jgi:hypothetical protein
MVTFRVNATPWTMRWRQLNRWSCTAKLTPGAPRRFGVPDYLFAASFGSRCSAQAWKKESLALAPLLQPPCAHLTRNIWLGCDHPLRQSATDEQRGGVIRSRLTRLERECGFLNNFVTTVVTG